MTIPANITSELTALQAQLAAAEPLSTASSPTIVALQLNTENFLDDVGAALDAASGTLDTWTAPVDPVSIVNGVLGLLSSAQDQNTLANIQGYVGRANANIDQLV